MKGANPGGVVLIAFGVFFLALAYTGRGAAVLAALKTGNAPATTASSSAPPMTTPPTPCPRGAVWDVARQQCIQSAV